MQDKKFIHQDDLELIERYFELDLTEAELQNITIRLQNDKKFRAQLRAYEYSHVLVEEIFDKEIGGEKKVFQESWETAFRAHKEKVAKEDAGSARIVAMPWRKYLVVAAASVALIFGLFWFLTKVSADDLTTAYWQDAARETPEMVRSGDEQDDAFDAEFEEAMRAFLKKDFKKVHDLLDNIPADYAGFNEVLILKGKAFTEEGHFEDAVAAFDEVFTRADFGSVDRALWLQALTFLKAANPEAAKGNLEKIVEKDYSKVLQKQAEVLLRALGD